MKYLKLFEGINRQEVIQTIEDICLDITDDGFKYKFYIDDPVVIIGKSFGDIRNSSIIIFPKKLGLLVKYSHLEKFVNRVEKYLQQEGIYVKTYARDEFGDWIYAKKIFSNEYIQSIQISFEL